MADITAGKHLDPFKWEPGKSANPAGRPKGSKNKLQEDFLRDVLNAWEVRGPEAITAMIAEKPGEFVKMVAGLMPKEATLHVSGDLSDLTDAELMQRARDAHERLAPLLADWDGREGVVRDWVTGSGKPN